MNTTIKKLISENFNINVNDLKVDEPVSVENFNMGIKAFNESTKKVEYAKIINVIYRGEKDCIKFKFKGRPQFEEPVAKKHMYAIAYDHKGIPSFTYAEDLKIGNKILSETSYEEIEDIQLCGRIKTFDLTTEFGNYFTNGVLSHNSFGAHLPACCVTPDTTIELI